MINVELKGGVIREYDDNITAAEVAKSIGAGLYKSVCAAKIDGQLVDLRTALTKDCKLELLTFDDEEGKKAFWHTTSHILAQAVKRVFPNAKFAIGPAIDDGFYYDFDVEKPFTTEDLNKIQAEMKKIVKEGLELERFELEPEKAIELLADVKIPNPEVVAKQYPHQLSGGMRQRVMIAMALACKPKILIADEPTTALDVTIQAQILKLINELKDKNNTAVLFITHDLGVINQIADDVAVMYCGQVVEMAPAHTIFHQNKHSHPYTEGLMLSIPRLDTPANTRLDAIPGAVPHPLDLPKGCKFAPRCKYATDKCREEEPQLVYVNEHHQVRCFYPDKEERHGK